MKIHFLIPCFTLEHFRNNIFRRKSGKIDIYCLIHALTFNTIFFERKGVKHKSANEIHKSHLKQNQK